MYDFIVKNLKHGHWVAVKTNDGEWKVFMYLRYDGNLEGTKEKSEIDYCLAEGLSSYNYSKEEIEKYFTEEYKIVTPAPVLLEPGTKVELIDSYKEKCKTINEILATYGPLTVTGIDAGTYFIRHVNGTHIYEVPHWAVAPIYETENKHELDNYSDDEIIAHLEKRGRLKDKKVIE